MRPTFQCAYLSDYGEPCANTYPLQLCPDCAEAYCPQHSSKQVHFCAQQVLHPRRTTLDIILSVADEAAEELSNREIDLLLRQDTPIMLRCMRCKKRGRLDQVTRGKAACGHPWANYKLDRAFLHPYDVPEMITGESSPPR